MVKRYTFIFLLCSLATSGTTLLAQRTAAPSLRDTGHPSGAAHAVSSAIHHRSDPIWSDDLSDPTHWTFGTLNGTANNWVIGTAVPNGDYPIPGINSTSAANGFALFDSDLLCSADNGFMATADSIDLSAVAHVVLQFEQFYRRFQGYTYVDVSNDGTNWTTFEVNSQLNTGQYTANADLFNLDISSVAALQSTVRFRFRYTGNCDYAWMVDDVALVEQPANEISLVSASTTSWDFDTAETFDSVYYSIFPVSEIRPLAVNMTVFNGGYEPATNVTAHITTSDGYQESGNLGTLAPGDTLTWFGPLWTPTATLGEHTVEFSVEADDADIDTTDNAASISVQVSNYVLARDNGARQTSVGDGDQAYLVGNWMHVAADHLLVGIQVALSSSSEVGVEVNGQLLDESRQLIAETGYHTVAEGDLNEVGEGNFIDLTFDAPVQLDAGGDYFVAFQHFGGIELWVGASGLSVPQSSMLYRASEDTWYSISPTPMVRMWVDDIEGIPEVFASGSGMIAWPNPADVSSRIEFRLDRRTEVDLELLDLNGRSVRTLLSGVKAPGTYRLDMDTHDLASGVYNCTLRTADGVVSRRIAVMH